jgi:hypothetical protein
MSSLYDEDGIDGPFERGATTTQRGAYMPFLVTVPGFVSIQTRTKSLAEIIKKKLEAQHPGKEIRIVERGENKP